MTHLSEARLMDVLEGVPAPADRRHVEACDRCRARVDHAREGMRLAGGADVPEPSPLYWEAFRQQVGRRLVAQEPALRWWRLASVFAASAAALALLSFLGPHRAGPGPAPLPAWSALPPAEEDAGLPILEALATNSSVSVECSLTACVDELSDEETRAAARLLRSEISGREL